MNLQLRTWILFSQFILTSKAWDIWWRKNNVAKMKVSWQVGWNQKRLFKEVDILTMKMNDVENSIYMYFNTIEIIYFYDFFKNGGK